MPEALTVTSADTVAAAARKIVAQQVLRMKTNLEGTRRDLHPEFLHDLRVAVRRLRSALRLLGPALGPRRTQSLRLELKWIGGCLGAVRDRDVLGAHLEGLRPRLGEAASVLDALASELALERAEAREALESALDGARFAALARRLEALASSTPPLRLSPFAALPAGEAAATFLRKAEKPVLALGSSLAASAPDEALHRLRILVKRLRYTAEFFGGAMDADPGAYIRALVAFQDCLGEHQDAVVALGRLESMAEAVAGRSGPEGLLSLGAVLQVERDIARERRRDLPKLWPEFRKRAARLRRKVRVRGRTSPPLKPSPKPGRRRAP